MNLSDKTIRYAQALGLAAALALLGTPETTRAAGAVRAALVEPVMPSRPLSEFLDGTVASGSGTGVLGITSLTVLNSRDTTSIVLIFATGVVGPTCNSPEVSGTRRTIAYLYVPPGSTTHLTYPSPLVVTPINGFSCVTTNPKPGIIVMFNGFIN